MRGKIMKVKVSNPGKMFKRIVVLLFCISFLMQQLLGTAIEVNAAEASYGKAYTMNQILNDYQFFVQGTGYINTEHTVGAVAIGGDATIKSFGDGAVEDSYFGNLLSAGNYNGSADSHYLKDMPEYAGYIGKKVYYKTATAAPAYATAWTEGTDYINFTQAFSELVAESAALAAAGTRLTVADVQPATMDGASLQAVYIPFSETVKNVTIPADVYFMADAIVIEGFEDTGINGFQTSQYIINIEGTDPVHLATSPSNKQAEGKPIGLNTNTGIQPLQNSYSLKKMVGAIQAGQMNMDGMKLIFNIPNATVVSTHTMAGHVVAPKADVEVLAGNFEGGVIAKSVYNTTAEGHFFPIDGVSDTTTPASVKDISMVKTFENNEVAGLNSGAFFTLFSDSACTLPIVGCTNVEATRASESDPFVVSFDESSLSVSTSYYLKEVTAPDGYVASSNIYECKVDAAGDVNYKVVGSADAYSTTFPTCNNEKEVIVIDPIKLNKTFEENGIVGNNSGAFFTLYSDSTCSTAVVSNVEAVRVGLTDQFLVDVDSTSLEAGPTYYLQEVTTPSDYELSDSIYECIIGLDGSVTYKVFGSADAPSATPLNCVNAKKTVVVPSAENITLIKTFEGSEITGLNSGAKFTLYSDENCLLPVVSDVEAVRADVADDFSVVVNGSSLSLSTTYYLKEVEAPSGYELSDNIYICNVDVNGDVTYKIKDSADAFSSVFPICHNVKTVINLEDIVLVKQFENDTITAQNSGAFFSLYSDAACTNVISANKEAIKLGGETEYKVTFSKDALSVSTTYYLREVQAPSGYELNATIYECVVDSTGNVTYKVLGSSDEFSSVFPICLNELSDVVEIPNGSVSLIKRFEASDIVGLNSGAYFTLFSDSDCLPEHALQANVEATRANVSEEFVVDFNELTLLKNVTYYIKEVQAPLSYEVNETIYECVIGDDGVADYRVFGSLNPFSDSFPICVNEKAVIVDPVAENIELIKTFENDEISGLSSGAFFQLYSDSSCLTTVGGQVEANRVSESDSFAVEILGTGLSLNTTYYLKEVTAPTGYELSNTIYECHVNEAGEVTYRVFGSGDSLSSIFPTCANLKTDEVITIEDVVLIKTFQNNLITGTNSGAFFTLYSNAACTNVIQANVQATKKALDAGYTVVFDGDLLQASSTYYLKETQAPTGYNLFTGIYECVVDDQGDVTYRLYNSGGLLSGTFLSCQNLVTNSGDAGDGGDEDKDPGNLVIRVIEDGTGKLIPGAVVEITLPDGSKIRRTTNSNGEIYLGDLTPGNYGVRVITVPSGYNYEVGREYTMTVLSNETSSRTIPVNRTTDGSSTSNSNTTSTASTSSRRDSKGRLLDSVPNTGE